MHGQGALRRRKRKLPGPPGNSFDLLRSGEKLHHHGGQKNRSGLGSLGKSWNGRREGCPSTRND